jgi:tRNA pseudouridine13 synthase
LVDYLIHHPTDFRGAIERLRPELRGLYLSAYQSHLWNRMLAQWLRENVPPAHLVALRLTRGEAPAHRSLDSTTWEGLAALRLPLPSARHALEPDDVRAALMNRVLLEEGIDTGRLKLRGLRRMFFSKGDRRALCLPANLEWETAPDELHPRRKKLMLRFQLSAGSYATLIVKRITKAQALPALPSKPVSFSG